MTEKMRPYLLEITIFGAMILLLSAGTFSRNKTRTALMLDPLLPNRKEIRRLVRLLEGLP